MRFGCHVVTEKLIQDVKSDLVGILNLIKAQCFIGSPRSIVFSRTLLFFFLNHLCVFLFYLLEDSFTWSLQACSPSPSSGTKVELGKSLLNSSVLLRIFYLVRVCHIYFIHTHLQTHTYVSGIDITYLM